MDNEKIVISKTDDCLSVGMNSVIYLMLIHAMKCVNA